MERIEKVRNVATWNVRRILYFEPVFEFPLSCHVQILDLPTRFVKLLAKLSSPQQRSTDFLYLPCKLFHNIYTIILEPSPHPFIPFALANFIVSYFFLSQQQLRVCIYIYTSLQFVESRNEQCILSIVVSLFRTRFLIPGQTTLHPRRLGARYLANLSLVFVRPFIFPRIFLASWRREIVVSKDTLMERILKNKRDVAGTEMKTAANSSFASLRRNHPPTITLRLNSKLSLRWWWNESGCTVFYHFF